MTLLENAPDVSALDGIDIVDCDAHMTEPPDLWTSRVPKSGRDKFPVQRTVDGTSAWYLDDELWCGIGGNTIEKSATGSRKVLGEHIVQPFEQIDKSAWDATARVELMDEQGVEAAIIYPNGIGFASNHIFAIEDHALRTEVLSVYNDWFMDVQVESGNRLFPQSMLPVWDMDLTVKEMTKRLDQGATGFTLSDKPELLGLPELDQPYFEPMWALANETGAVMNFHIGSGGSRALPKDNLALKQQQLSRPAESAPNPMYWSSFGPQRRLAILATQMYMSNARIIVNLCMSNLFDRFPKLKIASAESGIGWIPFILEAMEYQMDEMVTHPEEVGLTKRRPTEYFRDHIWVTFWFETSGPRKLIEDVGVNNILIETDVPHPTCVYPGTKARFARALGHLDRPVLQRILRDNAIELYKLPAPK